MQTENNDIAIALDPQDASSVMLAQYLMMRDPSLVARPFTMSETATQLGISRPTLYRYLRDWNESGQLDEMRKLLYLIRRENVDQASVRVLDRWPDVLNNLLEMATEGHGPTAINAAGKLYDMVVKPLLAVPLQSAPPAPQIIVSQPPISSEPTEPEPELDEDKPEDEIIIFSRRVDPMDV